LQNSDQASLCASSARLVAAVSLPSSATLIGFAHPQPSGGALILAQTSFAAPEIPGSGTRKQVPVETTTAIKKPQKPTKPKTEILFYRFSVPKGGRPPVSGASGLHKR